MTDQVTAQRRIGASPDVVWAMVSDVTRMGEWSPETTGCRWIGGVDGPQVGARFRGDNRNGWRRWSTTATVVEVEAGRRFVFDVAVGPAAVARWSYTFEPDGDGCVVTESWEDRRAAVSKLLGGVLSGVADRAEHNRTSMEQTLERLERAATADGKA